jgi:hypothetical protein
LEQLVDVFLQRRDGSIGLRPGMSRGWILPVSRLCFKYRLIVAREI